MSPPNLPVGTGIYDTADKRRALAKGRQDRQPSASLGVASLIVEQPGDVDTERREDATSRKERAQVTRRNLGLIFDKDENKIPNEADEGAAAHNVSSLPKPIADHSSRHAADKSHQVRRRSQPLRGDGRKSHVGHNRRQEIRQAGERIVAAEMDDCMHVILIVCHPGKDLLPLNARFLGAVMDLEPLHSEGRIFF